MPPLPSRKSLEALKRADLQRLCKDYGVRANLKSEALIDLLLDTQSVPAQTRRSVSRRISNKAGPSRVSSMIVHDTDEEEEEEEDTPPAQVKMPTPQPSLIPPPRTRKAKEMQVRLGVGKPQAAGGNGPRVLTRSSGSSRSQRLKSSRSLKPMEATIEEEPETISATTQATEPATQTAPSPPHQPQNSPVPDRDNTSLLVKKIVEEAVRPLQDQIHTLKSKLDEIETIKSDMANLRIQVSEISKAQNDAKVEFQSLRGLSTVVQTLKEEIQQLKEDLRANDTPPQPSTPKSQITQLKEAPVGFGMPSALPDLSGSPSAPPQGVDSLLKLKTKILPSHPGLAESALGKRHRDSVASDITGTGEVLEDGDLDPESQKTLRPVKKRPRIEKDAAVDSGKGKKSTLPASTSAIDEQTINEDMHNFSVFQGSEEPLDYLDPPPPTNLLPDFYGVESPTGSSSHLPRPKSTIATSSAHASENNPQPFGFGYLPISSTPQNPMYMSSFPYPEASQSPSPAGPSLSSFGGRHEEQRMDIFKPFGYPSPIRSTRNYGALGLEARGVNPAAITQGSTVKAREDTTHDTVASSDGPAGDPPISKRTMYGTELEGDTRFGDFGLEGMATDYWASGKF